VNSVTVDSKQQRDTQLKEINNNTYYAGGIPRLTHIYLLGVFNSKMATLINMFVKLCKSLISICICSVISQQYYASIITRQTIVDTLQ